jgi:hypothetical protein
MLSPYEDRNADLHNDRFGIAAPGTGVLAPKAVLRPPFSYTMSRS